MPAGYVDKITKIVQLHTIENTLFIGKVLMHFPSLESTNLYALSIISKNKPSEGTVISAHEQTAGRGQIGSTWYSESGKNITISIILYPNFLPPRQQFLLNQAIALGILDFVRIFIPVGVRIKWPNDIYINDQKAGGMLIQNSLSNHQLQYTVAGIGININQTHFHPDIPNPTSFKLQLHHSFELQPLLAVLCHKVEHRYLQLRNRSFERIQRDYLESLFRYMEEALFQRADGGIFSGKITGLAESGKLLIHHQSGDEAFDMKEIKFVL